MDVELKLCYKYNGQLLKHYSKSFYISTLLLPRNKQKAVFALYGFCRFADNLVDKPRNRLKEDLIREIHCLEEELKNGYRYGESEHPVICAFIHVAKQYQIPMDYPMELFKGILMDVEHQRYNDFDELVLFSHRVAGVVGLMMTHIIGYTSDKAFDYAEKLGIAMQLTNILRDIQEDKNNGRIYIPQEEMKRFHVRTEDIVYERFTPSLKNLMAFSVDRAHRYYEEANRGIDMLKRECQFAIYSASTIYRNILYGIEKNDYNPFRGRVFVSQTKKTRLIFSNYIKGKLHLNFRSI